MSYFIDLYNNLFHKKKLEYVFTPGVVARTNYLPRKELEKRIFKSLRHQEFKSYFMGIREVEKLQ